MRNCSRFEQLFDGYLEGTLAHMTRVRVEAHLAQCESCRDFMAELRIIDGLLVTAPEVEPAPNFTFAVMAEVRSLPVPKAPPSYAWAWIAGYLAFAWIAIGAWIATGRPSGQAASAALASLTHLIALSMNAFVTASRVAAHQPSAVFWFVGVLLVLDVTVALAAIAFYLTVRPRLLARLARRSEAAA